MVESREKPRGREVAGTASALPAVNARAVDVELDDVAAGEIRGFCPVCHHFFELDEPRCPGDDTALIVVDPSSGERVGEVLEERLTLLDLVGSGGMGAVYRAYQHSMEREVAVKLLHRSYSDDPIQVRRFLREAKGASQLAHPNVITLFDFGKSSEGELYLVMELLKGRSLAEIIRSEGTIDFERAVALIAQVCDALQAAHDVKVIHRDIKPDNIFVVGGAGLMGEFVKVIDFGLAKMALATPVSKSSQRGKVNGTPAYMSPEQIMGREVDARSDVYALGVVLYEMISGRLPFMTRQAARMLVAHITERPAPLTEVFPDAQRPRELDDVVQATLAKQPHERPESAHELRCQLQRALAAFGKNLPSRPVRRSAPASSFVAHDGAPSLASHPLQPQTLAAAARSDFNRTLLGKRSSGSVIFDAEVEMWRPVPPVASHLPATPSSFVGRREDLTALEGLLVDGHRLITIHGPAGIGKTRLTLQLASSFIDGRSQPSWRGIWFCDLADVQTTEDICHAVARGMNLSLPGRQSIESTIKQLGSAIAARGKVLLILDNFEQLIDYASVTVGAWHELAPEACFLITTRTVLHLSDERVFELEPLSLPKENDGEVSEACQLFFERAQSARPDWRPTEADREAIRAIVQRLDGLPLAIELAAARMSILSLSKLLQRLTERFELLSLRSPQMMERRRVTLKGAIEWSWELLEEQERSAFSQLAVFVGGFSLEAAEAVVELADFEGAPWIGDILHSLKEKSLLRVTEETELEGELRFGLLESIGAFAAEKLEQSGELERARQRHARYFLDHCQELVEVAESDGSPRAMVALSFELKNLMALHAWVVEQRPPTKESATMALRAVCCLDPVLTTRGPFGSHLDVIDRALECARGHELPKALLSNVLRARGEARRTRGLLAESATDLERALLLARESGDRQLEGRVMWTLGALADGEGRLGKAREILTSALDIQREVEDRVTEGKTHGLLGIIAFWMGNLEQARYELAQALLILQEHGDRFEGLFLGALAAVSQEAGALNEARMQYEQAIEALRKAGARRHEGMILGYLGGLEWEQGRFGEARRRLEQSIAIAQEVGDRRNTAIFYAVLGGLDATEELLHQAENHFQKAELMLRELDNGAHCTVVELHRGHLDLALNRRASVMGPLEEATARGRSIQQRIEAATSPCSRDKAPTERSDDVRFALRMLRRALEN